MLQNYVRDAHSRLTRLLTSPLTCYKSQYVYSPLSVPEEKIVVCSRKYAKWISIQSLNVNYGVNLPDLVPELASCKCKHTSLYLAKDCCSDNVLE